ncbi:related to YSC84-protein involved in the organization of the actin cytoskeleton [Rhynchosporium agropyri]|uniref:Related to YSC84-protein involved in the organization of the actin cytoskeleton n=1 Tax=Rhynchosporium agropyri TaxID=914238 RepID=A0A1E1K172_9HELO|nr:related to YSC84-protein involved in the organization of the actin cytoskeleton [Rhynchosporium agropyri]
MGLFTSSTIEKESTKAAQILNSFIIKNKIPQEAIANAKGIAIFSAIRGGMWVAGSGGSGIVIARLPSGLWSPPSAFTVRSGGVGIVWGVDMYDCVLLLNTSTAVEAYSKSESSLGGGVALAAGPAGWNGEKREEKPVWMYTKSRGLYGGLTIDGTVVKEREGANEGFYGRKVSAKTILKGEAADGWPNGAEQLIEVLKLAEGKFGDKKVLQGISKEPTPGDLED